MNFVLVDHDFESIHDFRNDILLKGNELKGLGEYIAYLGVVAGLLGEKIETASNLDSLSAENLDIFLTGHALGDLILQEYLAWAKN